MINLQSRTRSALMASPVGKSLNGVNIRDELVKRPVINSHRNVFGNLGPSIVAQLIDRRTRTKYVKSVGRFFLPNRRNNIELKWCPPYLAQESLTTRCALRYSRKSRRARKGAPNRLSRSALRGLRRNMDTPLSSLRVLPECDYSIHNLVSMTQGHSDSPNSSQIES